MEVASLPDLSSNMDADRFASQVIEHLKTNLIAPLVYENETELPHQPYDFLNSLVSQCLLPVGDWSFLDSLYDDNADLPSCNTYLSRMEENWFLIGHKYYLIDAGNGWHGLVPKYIGVPSTATLWANKYYSDWFSYTITLTLMN